MQPVVLLCETGPFTPPPAIGLSEHTWSAPNIPIRPSTMAAASAAGNVARMSSAYPGRSRRTPLGPQIAQATPQDEGITLAFTLSFAYCRWRTEGHSARSRRYRLRHCRTARRAILDAGEWARESALWELLSDHHPALVRWARRQLGTSRWQAAVNRARPR